MMARTLLIQLLWDALAVPWVYGVCKLLGA